MMIWKVCKHYHNSNVPIYEVLPFDSSGYLTSCFKWYGFKALRWCYLFKKQAERKADKLNKLKIRE